MRLRIRLLVALGLAAVATYLVNLAVTIIAQKERAIQDLHERLSPPGEGRGLLRSARGGAWSTQVSYGRGADA